MRISTSAMHTNAIDALLDQQIQLSRTQGQVASGKKIQTPADDPIGAVHILELQRAKAETEQYQRNSDAAIARLTAEEQALADVGTLLQRMRELALQANNATVDATARYGIATELAERARGLLDVANRQDGNSEYLFAGYATTTRPFARGGAAVNYLGDQGTRLVQIGPTQRVADGHSGHRVFADIREGNGTFVTGVSAANTGSGIVDTGVVTNAAAWVPDDYTLTFTSATTWEVRNSATTMVASGAYTSGSSIAFNGIQVSVSGAPATGDNFSVNASGREDMFTTIDNMVAALQQAGDNPADRARLNVQLNTAIQQLDQDITHVLNVRAEVGARLSMMDDVNAAREVFDVELQRNLSDLQDVDYAEAISRMNRQLLGLQAAQQSYTRVSQLSLFDYL
jgi:flagellar hook-associated protein 3 FlgL